MRYLLLIGNDAKTPAPISPAESETLTRAHARFHEELRAKGKVISADRLRPESDAARVRMKAGHPQVTDGPFAETKEALGGFYLIECDSKDEAIEWAAKLPFREGSFVDVRPIFSM